MSTSKHYNDKNHHTDSKKKILALTNVNIIDGTGQPIQNHQTILIEGNTIKKISPNNSISLPNSAEIIDLTEKFILPGFFDVHMHLTFPPNEDQYWQFTPADGALNGSYLMQQYLRSGVTSIRDVGGSTEAILALERMSKNQKIKCGRLFPCGPILTTSAGHGAEDTIYPYKTVEIADTPNEFRILIRKLYNKGIRHIKISPFYRRADLKAIIEECTLLNIPVTTHGGGVKDTHPPTMVQLAVEAGVNSVEHIPLMDPNVLNLIKEKNIFLVPTLSIYRSIYENGFPSQLINRGWTLEKQENLLKQAINMNILIGIGTDYIYDKQSEYPQCYFEEMQYMQQLGMSPLEIIKSASLNGAKIVRQKNLGCIRPGKLADLQVLKNNPLEDLSQLGSPEMVIFDGEIIN